MIDGTFSAEIIDGLSIARKERLDAVLRGDQVKNIGSPAVNSVLQKTHEAQQTAKTVESDDEDRSTKNWQDEANCVGVEPNVFFPERGASTREAKDICRGCVVRLDCLDYALTKGEKFGIWGGLSERERRRLRRQQALASRKGSPDLS